ncbi:MAG TPA: GH92 family glycosyl hydrolase [Mycobacteriales bacterium]|nr:GH92 family glycosyl hydrolase [Mycobacteriales bacterium]
MTAVPLGSPGCGGCRRASQPARRRLSLAVAAGLVLLSSLPAVALPRSLADGDPVSAVNPLSGTAGAGFPFVGAMVPFGMIQAGPDTGVPGQADPINYTGYAYQDSTVRGFSLTHFSGAGAHLAGDVSFLPTTGPIISTDPDQYASPFSHAAETASPGFYRVRLAAYGTTVAVTAATRSAMFRFQYPSRVPANVLVDVSHSLPGAHSGAVSVVGADGIQGWARTAAGPRSYTVFFVARFDHRFSSFGTWDASGRHPGSRAAEGAAGAYLSFDTSADPVVTMRVAISYVDVAGAAENLDSEIPAGRSFASVRRDAVRAWYDGLSRIEVRGGSVSERRTFYTCLYRALMMPSVFEDVTGRYRGFDGRVHVVVRGHHHYTNLSLWDTYRTQTPLLGLLAPGVVRDVMSSLLDDYDQNGRLFPRWVMANVDTGVMSGYPAVLTLAEGINSGLVLPAVGRRAYRSMLRQATLSSGRWPYQDLKDYLRYGFVGFDHSPFAASDTLEYALADAALLTVARRFGTVSQVAMLTRRAADWRRLLDPTSDFLRPRESDGTWASPSGVGPLTVFNPALQDGFQEGTGWQYLWSVPQDIPGLVRAIGGVATARSRLDQFFTEVLQQRAAPVVPVAQQYGSLFGVYYAGDQYTPGNEPDLWAPWYYDWMGEPWKSQQVVQGEMRTYSARPDGLPGNDDAGELSSWYVLAALGLYPADPALPLLAVSTPAFTSVVIKLESGRTFDIEAPGGGGAATRYITSASLDGHRLISPSIPECALARGGMLRYTTAATPDRSWASAPGDAPTSSSATGCS